MKVDFYAQLIFIIILAIAGSLSVIPGMGGYSLFALLGLMPLGIWQLISAGVNTYRFKTDPLKHKWLNRYWTAAIACLVLFFLSFALRNGSGQNSIPLAITIVSITCSALVAIFYLYIYKKVLIPGAIISPDTEISTPELDVI
jgi:hypothetical protein